MRRHQHGFVAVNTAANFLSQFVAPATGLILIPVYVRMVGPAGYGLIALLAALLASTGVVTRGLGWSLQREVAQARAAGDEARLRRLVRTFATAYLAIAIALAAVLASLSSPLSSALDSGDISRQTIRWCLVVLSLRLITLFPTSVYSATMLGTQRQLRFNVITSVSLVVGTATTVAGLAITRSVLVIYLIDLAVSTASLLTLRRSVTHDLRVDGERTSSFLSRSEVRALAGLSGGLVWIQAIGVLIRQVDRFIVGAVTSLALLGVYNSAIAAGRILSLAYNPYLAAIFPVSCAMAERDPTSLPDHLITNSKVVALTCFGVGVPVALAGHQLLVLWTGDKQVADQGTPVLWLFVVATMFLSLADAHSQVQTAMGTTRCAVVVNTAAIFWLAPSLWLLVRSLGIPGAGWVWLTYSVTAWAAFTYYSFTRLMPGHLLRYLLALVRPLLIIATGNGLATVLALQMSASSAVGYLAIAVPLAMVVLLLTAVDQLGMTRMRHLVRGASGRERSNQVSGGPNAAETMGDTVAGPAARSRSD